MYAVGSSTVCSVQFPLVPFDLIYVDLHPGTMVVISTIKMCQRLNSLQLLGKILSTNTR